jgi:TetR/AcrR family transcriptional regulator, cholesterol catabolism regulator
MFTEQQEKWLTRVEELFLRYGIKSITMDDVARELGISKKTLYQFVESKDALVDRVIERHIEFEKAECARMIESSGNAIEQMLQVIESNRLQLSQMKSNIVHDMQKYYRNSWEKMSEFQRGFLYRVVRDNLERGIAEGLYRTDFDADIVAKMHLATSFQLFDQTLFPSHVYRLDAVFEEYLKHYLYGILSDEGRIFIQKNNLTQTLSQAPKQR